MSALGGVSVLAKLKAGHFGLLSACQEHWSLASTSSPSCLQWSCLRIRSILQKIQFSEIPVLNWIGPSIFLTIQASQGLPGLCPFQWILPWIHKNLSTPVVVQTAQLRVKAHVCKLNNFFLWGGITIASSYRFLWDCGFHGMLLRPFQVEVHMDHKALSLFLALILFS